MNASMLPSSSWVSVPARKLARPQVVWQSRGAIDSGFNPASVFCCPKEYEAPELYADEERLGWADRYGGTGVGRAGGSGRCLSFEGMQVKGAGVTPLVAPDGDRFHSSGTLMLVEAAAEAVFSAAYNAALPFGAVPVHAVVLTGGRYVRDLGHDAAAKCIRSLVVRPFVARPAHFTRNVLHPAARLPAGADASGWSADASRVRKAMATLSAHFGEIGISTLGADEAEILDAGFRELARRYAWQTAAGFAKRLPHGTLSCSNISLDGAYLDFGLSNFVPSYRRLCWAERQDPWTEADFAIRAAYQLRQQFEKYSPEVISTNVVSAEAMVQLYRKEYRNRMMIEMAKMAGLTEDMISDCPRELLEKWLAAMEGIWQRSAGEPFVTQEGRMLDGTPAPAPRKTGRYSLEEVFKVSAGMSSAEAMDLALAPIIDDAHLCDGFVRSALDVRSWWLAKRQCTSQAVAAYLARQSTRKNASMPLLRRDEHANLGVFRDLEIEGAVEETGRAIQQAIAQAEYVLSDLDPALPGSTGWDQLMACDAITRTA